MAQIICRDLTLGYDSGVLVKDLSFEVDKGDFLFIVGNNGSGKTTLMRTLLRLQQPLSGSISFGDGAKPVTIGYLPQQTDVQKDFPASVWEIVLSGCQNSASLRPIYSKAEKKTAQENMEKLGIANLKNTCYRELSGGQQQRVLLARALCAAKSIILLDEPVSGLDPGAAAQMYSLLQELNDEGMTVIMISHDVDAALIYASHILHIGSETFFGTADEYMASSIGKRYISLKSISSEENTDD